MYFFLASYCRLLVIHSIDIMQVTLLTEMTNQKGSQRSKLIQTILIWHSFTWKSVQNLSALNEISIQKCIDFA